MTSGVVVDSLSVARQNLLGKNCGVLNALGLNPRWLPAKRESQVWLDRLENYIALPAKRVSGIGGLINEFAKLGPKQGALRYNLGGSAVLATWEALAV